MTNGTTPNTRWMVETIVNGEFVKLGTVKVNGNFADNEMRTHNSIKGHEPHDIAENIAHKRFPNANPIIVSRIWGRGN